MPPYLQQVGGEAGSTDPRDYEGFMKDVLDEMGKLVPFDYTLHIQGHGVFGTRRNGTWDGIVGEVLYNVRGLKLTIHFRIKIQVKF